MTATPAGVPIVEERPSAAERLTSLKLLKNAIVGNPKAKKAVVDEGAIYWMFDWLADIEYVGEDETLTWNVRVEAARVISTLANGCPYATLRLVRNRVIDALLLSITNLRPNRSKELDVALSTALKSVAASCSAIIGPLDSGLPEFYSHAERDEAKQVLERLFKVTIITLFVFELTAYLVHGVLCFQPDTMDVYLPMLERSTAAATELAYMLHACLSCWETSTPRRIMSQWSPSHLPHRPTPSPSRPRGGSPAGENSGGWVVDKLLSLAREDSPKACLLTPTLAQEAALLAVSALAADNPGLCGILTTPRPNDIGTGLAPLTLIFDLTLSLNSSVQFAALRCAARILRGCKEPPSQIKRMNRATFNPVLTLILQLNQAIVDTTLSLDLKTKCCYIFAILVTDSIPILDTIHQTKSLTTLLKILVDGRPSRETSEWADEVPRAAVRLREAAFLAIAAATLHTQENRREVLNSPVSYIDMVIEGLNDKHVNIRYAACHAARAMSRSTEVQQTTAMDSGLAEKLWEALQKEKDSRVEVVILMCLTNLKMFQQGAIQYIVGMMDRPETSVQLNAIWTIRNTLWRANPNEHQKVFTHMGFDRFYRHATLLTSNDRQVRQQAIILARNTTTSLQMFEFIREGLGLQRLFNALAEGLDIDEDELALQAACTLDNIACLVDRRLFLDQGALLTVLKKRVKTRSGRARHAVFQLLKSIAGDELGAKGLRERGFDVAIAEALRDADPLGMETDGGEWKITATQALKILNR
ncbi:hypothetical protein FS837_006679 [Tulasnella sp. UAMH 9824]|nr:hypothetical protein FS837_006679 [Tulasnella sp. UAMH 9824]